MMKVWMTDSRQMKLGFYVRMSVHLR